MSLADHRWHHKIGANVIDVAIGSQFDPSQCQILFDDIDKISVRTRLVLISGPLLHDGVLLNSTDLGQYRHLQSPLGGAEIQNSLLDRYS